MSYLIFAAIGALLFVWWLRRGGEIENPSESESLAFKLPPRKWECRVERFDVIWLCVVTSLPASKEVVSSVVGVPHCKACVIPFNLSEAKEWVCSQCAAKHPESVADVIATDLVAKEAAQLFLEKNKGYRLAASRVSGKSSLM